MDATETKAPQSASDEDTEVDDPRPHDPAADESDSADAADVVDLVDVDEESPEPVEPAEPVETTETKRGAVTIIDCPVCKKPVRTRRLARHQRSQKCQMAAVLALQAQDAAAEEAKTRAQKKKLLAPRRTFLDVPMVSAQGALTTGLLDFLLNTANTAAATAHDAVSCLRKIAGVKYPVSAELTAPQLYALLVDTDTLQAFFRVLEASGMKAVSRKRYVDAIRLGLTWLETRSPQEPGTPAFTAVAAFIEVLTVAECFAGLPLAAAVNAMKAMLSIQKKGLARKSKTQKGHLSHKALLASGRMLTEEELAPLLRQAANEYSEAVEAAERQFHLRRPTAAVAFSAQKRLVVCLALGVGVTARGGDMGRLSVEHVKEGAADGYLTLENHKTAATHGPLVLPCPPWLHWMLDRWVVLFRPPLAEKDPEAAGDSLFLSFSGKPVVQASKELLTPYIKEKTGKHITFTAMRKFYETVSFHSFDDATQKRISQAQCHRDTTAQSHYQLRDQTQSAQASHAAFDARLGLSAAITGSSAPSPLVSSSSASSSSSLSSSAIVVTPLRPPAPPKPELPIPAIVVASPLTAAPLAAVAPLAPVGVVKSRGLGLRRRWTPGETDALLRALARWEHTSQPGQDTCVPWLLIKLDGKGALDSRPLSSIKDKTRVLTPPELAQLNKYRDELGVAQEHRRHYTRIHVGTKRTATAAEIGGSEEDHLN